MSVDLDWIERRSEEAKRAGDRVIFWRDAINAEIAKAREEQCEAVRKSIEDSDSRLTIWDAIDATPLDSHPLADRIAEQTALLKEQARRSVETKRENAKLREAVKRLRWFVEHAGETMISPQDILDETEGLVDDE